MKKSQKKMLVQGVIGIVVLLGLSLWYGLGVLPKQQKKKIEGKVSLLGKIYPSDLASIELTVRQKDYQETTILSNTSRGWVMVSPVKDRLDPDMLGRLLESLTNLKSERVFTNITPKDFKGYGFDKPADYFVFHFKNGKQKSIINGQMATTENYYYTIVNGVSNKVYLVYAYKFSGLERMSGELRDRTLWNLPFEKLDSVNLSFPSGLRIQVVKNDNGWQMISPVKGMADDFAFKKRILNFFTLRILNFPPQLKETDRKVVQKNRMAELIFTAGGETNDLLMSRIRVSNQVLCMSTQREGLFTMDYEDITNVFDFKPSDLLSNK